MVGKGLDETCECSAWMKNAAEEIKRQTLTQDRIIAASGMRNIAMEDGCRLTAFVLCQRKRLCNGKKCSPSHSTMLKFSYESKLNPSWSGLPNGSVGKGAYLDCALGPIAWATV